MTLDRFPYHLSQQRKDVLDKSIDHGRRLRALETGAHPTRLFGGSGETTEWFELVRAAGWTGHGYWRISQNNVQLRGELDGPGGWADGALAAVFPPDIFPAWPLTVVCATTAGSLTRVLLTASGQIRPYRDGGANLLLDAIHFARG